jgi:O-antigen ligase
MIQRSVCRLHCVQVTNLMLELAFFGVLLIVIGIFLMLLFIKVPEFGAALLLVAAPAITGLLELVVGEVPIKTLLVHLFFGVIFLIFFFQKGKSLGLLNPILVGSIFLGIWLAVGLIYTPDRTYGDFKTQRYFLENVFMILPAVVFYKSTWRVERFLKYVLFLGWLLCFYSVFWILTGNLGNERLAPGSYQVIPFGRILALTILAAVALHYLKRQKGVYKPTHLLYLLLAFPLLIAAVTRGALLSLLVAIFVLMLIQGDRRYILTRIRRFAFIFGLLVLFLFLVVPLLPDFARVRLVPGSDGWGSFGLRQMQLERTTSLFLQSPLVGQGTGGFRAGDETAFIYPHNIFAELLSENGIIGFGLFTVILFVGFGSAIRVLRKRPRPDYGLSAAEWRYHKSCMSIMLAFSLLYFGNAQTSFDLPGNAGLWFFLTACYILRLNLQREIASRRAGTDDSPLSRSLPLQAATNQ